MALRNAFGAQSIRQKLLLGTLFLAIIPVAVTSVIVLLLVTYTVVATIQGISADTGHGTVGEVAGIFSPYTLVNGVQVFLFDSPAATRTPPTGTGMGLLYLAVATVTGGALLKTLPRAGLL